MDISERIANIEIKMESQKRSLGFYLKYILEKNGHQDSEDLMNKFIKKHEELLKGYVMQWFSISMLF